MKITTKLTQPGLIVAVAIALLPFSAHSEGFPARGPTPYFAFDKDNNGFISEQEFNEVRGARMAARAAEGRAMRGAASAPAFSALDTNHDGQLTREELITGQRAHMEKRRAMRMSQRGENRPDRPMGRGMGRNMPVFPEFDIDRDGNITQQEFEQGRGKRMAAMAQRGHMMKHAGEKPSFADIDTDGDGGINSGEFADHKSKCRMIDRDRGMGRDMGAARYKGRGMEPGMNRRMGPGRGMGRSMPFFSEFDLNRDRKVTEKEFNEARSKRMAERAQQGYQMKNAGKSHSLADIDTNRDGEISMREFAEHQFESRQQRRR